MTDTGKLATWTLKAVFLATVYFISTRVQADLPPYVFWTLAVLAVLRVARTISFNEICEDLRAPFTQVKKDSCGAGADVCPKGTGAQYVIGSLISCPICTGQWGALVLVLAYVLAPSFGTWLIIISGLAGGSEVVHYAAQYLEWGARKSRVISGSISPDKE